MTEHHPRAPRRLASVSPTPHVAEGDPGDADLPWFAEPGDLIGGLDGDLDRLHVDCDACLVRGPACHDCVVTALLGPPPELAFDEEERRALEVLAGSGLVPPLRMVRAVTGPEVGSA